MSDESVTMPLSEYAAPGLTEKCLALELAWSGFDGSPTYIAKVGALIGQLGHMATEHKRAWESSTFRPDMPKKEGGQCEN